MQIKNLTAGKRNKTMSSKSNIKDIKNKQEISLQDVIMYRLIVLFFFGILGFAALRNLSDIKSTMYQLYPVIKWVALALLIATIVFLWYVKKYRSIDERGKIVTSVGISAFTISLSLMIMLYKEFKNVEIKYQVYFVAAIILAFIYNLYSESFFKFSILTVVYAFILCYKQLMVDSLFENLLKNISQVIIYVLPAIIIGIIIYAMHTKQKALVLRGKTIFKFTSPAFRIPYIVLSLFILVAAIVLIFTASAYVYIIMSLFVLYLVFGIICTIKLI